MTIKEPTKKIILLVTEDSPAKVIDLELKCTVKFNKSEYLRKGDLLDLTIDGITWEYVYKNIVSN